MPYFSVKSLDEAKGTLTLTMGRLNASRRGGRGVRRQVKAFSEPGPVEKTISGVALVGCAGYLSPDPFPSSPPCLPPPKPTAAVWHPLLQLQLSLLPKQLSPFAFSGPGGEWLLAVACPGVLHHFFNPATPLYKTPSLNSLQSAPLNRPSVSCWEAD